MYNSPRTPTGTGSIFRSSTYIVVLPIGRPMGTTAASPALAWWTEDQIVVSVGPYMFHTEPQRARSSFAIEPERDSPPHRAFRRGLPVQPAASNICQLAGVPCITVTLYLSSIFVRRNHDFQVGVALAGDIYRLAFQRHDDECIRRTRLL